jgi:mannose-6-phosphate isomerase
MSDKRPAIPPAPIFFERNRVFRVYRGGRLFHGLFGDPAEDGSFPEEWVASTVKAQNRESRGEHEGVSLVQGSRVPFSTLMETNRPELLGERASFDLLVKILHSAERLPVQAHPDKAFARRHFGSAHGKTEMWLVLATEGQAQIYLGFREGVRRQDLVDCIRASETDREAGSRLLNQVPVAPGDIYLIPAGLAHTIGAGCLILEAEEPTDWMILAEAWCGDYHLTPAEMYMGLEEETALGCFDFETLVGETAIRTARKAPRPFRGTASVIAENLLTLEDTPDFSVNRYKLRGGTLPLDGGPSVFVVTEGEGSIESPVGSRGLRTGDYFFLPACARGVSLSAASALEVVECLPPAPQT